MVGAWSRRIVPVIRGDDQQVVGAYSLEDHRELLVEAFQVCGVARNVVSMAVLRVEIDEIGEDQPLRGLRQRLRDRFYASRIAARWNAPLNPAARKQVT